MTRAENPLRLTEAAPPRRAVAPHSSVAADENAIANELVHVVHSWVAEIAPSEPEPLSA